MRRRLKYLYASKEFIADLLKTGTKAIVDGLPHDAIIINIVYRPEYDVFHIIVHSNTFKELEECELMEQLPALRITNV